MQRTFNLADLFELVCQTVPDRDVLSYGAEKTSYALINQNADAVAAFLLQQGVKRGDNVGLQLTNCPAYLEAFFACCKIGAIPFNINYRYTGTELEYLYTNSKARAVFFNHEMSEAVASAVSAVGGIETLVCVGENAVESFSSYAEILNTQAAAPDYEGRRDDDLIMTYTGGTTGMPKGVMWPHKSLFFGALGGASWYHPGDPITEPAEIVERVEEGYFLTTFPVAPLMHGAAFWTAMSSVFAGHTVVLNDQVSFSAELVWDLVEREGVQIMAIVGDAMGVPMAEALEQHPERWDLSRFNHLGSGGAVFSKDVQQRIKNVVPTIVTASSLGATETGVMGPGNKSSEEGLMSYQGREDITVIADGRIAKKGELGIVARRGYLPIGYFDDAEKTAATFVNIDGVDHAMGGDTARIEQDGSITILGRGSTCINTGGEKVFPEEVEQVLKSHPAVHDALVVGLDHSRWTQQVTALISLRPDQSASAAELKEHCLQDLAAYKVPKEICFADTLQRSVVGKPDYVWAKEQLLKQLE